MKAYSLGMMDTTALLNLNAVGSRKVIAVVAAEAHAGRNSLVNEGLATIEGNVMTITDKGREWCQPYKGPNGEPF